jgi:hypothetical protein
LLNSASKIFLKALKLILLILLKIFYLLNLASSLKVKTGKIYHSFIIFLKGSGVSALRLFKLTANVCLPPSVPPAKVKKNSN